LGNAIRKIRIDLGIPIAFGPFPITSRAKATQQGSYWARARIRYSTVDGTPEDSDGLLLYIKPGILGNEPRDIYNYAQVSTAFPHESTADQFFSETQFESYRALGEYIVDRVVAERPILDYFDAKKRMNALKENELQAQPVQGGMQAVVTTPPAGASPTLTTTIAPVTGHHYDAGA
jgi:hypothetical protein